MAAKKNRHAGHYLSLVLILCVGFSALAFSYPNKRLEMLILLLIAFFYACWGIFHHAINHSLSTKIVVEYILVAALGIAALLFFLTGAFGI